MTIYAASLGLRARFDRPGCDRGCEVARTGRSRDDMSMCLQLMHLHSGCAPPSKNADCLRAVGLRAQVGVVEEMSRYS